MLKIETKNFRENNTEALVISKKTQVSLKMRAEQIQVLKRRLQYISRDLKVL